MSNVDVFTIGLDQIHDLQKHGHILPFTDEVLWNSWLIVDCWASFGKFCGYVDTFTCLGVKHAFDLVAHLQDFNMGMIDRGVSGHGRHYEIWHVVDDSDVEWYPTMEPEFEGEGWYTISYSDGGQDYTNDGPVWVEDALSFAELMTGAMETATDIHLPYALYHGTGEDVDNIDPEPVDWFDEMGDTLGEDESLRECIDAWEYVRAIDELF